MYVCVCVMGGDGGGGAEWYRERVIYAFRSVNTISHPQQLQNTKVEERHSRDRETKSCGCAYRKQHTVHARCYIRCRQAAFKIPPHSVWRCSEDRQQAFVSVPKKINEDAYKYIYTVNVAAINGWIFITFLVFLQSKTGWTLPCQATVKQRLFISNHMPVKMVLNRIFTNQNLRLEAAQKLIKIPAVYIINAYYDP